MSAKQCDLLRDWFGCGLEDGFRGDGTGLRKKSGRGGRPTVAEAMGEPDPLGNLQTIDEVHSKRYKRLE